MRRRAPSPRGGLDIYLLPAVVGGGLGDIAEVLDAGSALANAGFDPVLYRPPGRRLPASVDGPWDFSRVERRTSLEPTAKRAITITPSWGVSAARERPGRLGRPGPWAREASDIEERYGPDSTLHISLEEFARTLTSPDENEERWREGGVAARAKAHDRRTTRFRDDALEFHRAYREFRGFDRPNLLHLYQTFRASAPFAREYPEAVQIGPIWPPTRAARAGVAPVDPSTWIWYASPSSSAALVEAIDAGLRGSPVTRVRVRSPRPFPLPSYSPIRWSADPAFVSSEWSREFGSAGVRIVTGSRTLLEALRLRSPFLYFNGTMGAGPRRRRHRPEKIQALIRAWGARGVSGPYLRDLDDFSRGRRVAEIVGRAATDGEWRRRFPRISPVSGFSMHREDGGRFLVSLARSFANDTATAGEFVRRVRVGGGRRSSHQL
ncbi:MAG: hypothetical protein L3K18_04710 [Thermoplasmata archaeon]|nr:hypothetical protein [Thermoplasmata archaeon]MCI4356428.1 hypothetical protein [Thermoplasmata archaeon]